MVRESELEQGVIKVKIEGEQERKDVENRNG